MRAIEHGRCNLPLLLKQNLIKECLTSSLQTGSRGNASRTLRTKRLLKQERVLLEWLERQDRGKLFSLNKTCHINPQFRCIAEKGQSDKSFFNDCVPIVEYTGKNKARSPHKIGLKVLIVNTWADKTIKVDCHFLTCKYDRDTYIEQLDDGDDLTAKSTYKALLELTFERQKHESLGTKTRVVAGYMLYEKENIRIRQRKLSQSISVYGR